MTTKMIYSLRGLEWLVDELDTSLGLAREALLAYRSDPEDSSQLSFALGYLHQVSGSLTMAQCYGAVLLANEMEASLKLLLDGSSRNVADTCEALELTMLALPNYVRDLLDGCDDTLAQLMEQVNELRTVRAEPLISSTALFMPNMAMFDQQVSSQGEQHNSAAAVDKALLEKLQKVYQYALLGYLKQREVDNNQQKITAVLKRLQSTYKGDSLEALWRVASAFFAGLVANNISQSSATRHLLWELDKTLRSLVNTDEPSVADIQAKELLRNLLFYIALVPNDSVALNAIKEEFTLDQAFPSLVLSERDGALQTRLDGAVVAALSEALSAEITLLRGASGSSQDGERADRNRLEAIKITTQRLAATLMMVGQIKLSQSLLEVAGMADQAMSSGADISPDLAMAMTRLQSIQKSLQDWALNYAEAPLASDLLAETAYVVDDAQRSLIREVRNNFESIKDAIVGYIASQWDGKFLLEIPGQFEHIFGAVEVIGLKRVAVIVEQLGNYITRELLQREEAPEWSALDALADAITGFEYYLEAIDKGREGEQRDMLRLTAQAMEKLGFAVELDAEQDAEPPVVDELMDEVELLPDAMVLDSEEDEIDPEIKEIFIEEAQEVLAELETHYPTWLHDQSDHNTLNDLRRGFHTLKGSGRMVKAGVIGDLAWAIEKMLNKVLDTSGLVAPETGELLDLTLALMPSLVDDFDGDKQQLSPYCSGLIAAAEALTKGEPVNLPQAEGHSPDLDVEEQLAVDLSGLTAEEYDSVVQAESEERVEIQPVVHIFVGEAGDYIDTLANFLDNFQQPSEDLRLAPTDVQRALHTLQASAGMAGFTAVSELAGTLEDFLIVLFARGQNISSSIIALLMNGVERFYETLVRLEAGEDEDSATLNEYRSRVDQVRANWHEQRVASAEPKGLARVKQLMVAGLEHVLVADTLLEQWGDQAGFSRQDIDALLEELAELGAAAEDSGVSSLSTLCAEFARALDNLAASSQGFSDDVKSIFKSAHEQILNMMDIVAIGQVVDPAPEALLVQLIELAQQQVDEALVSSLSTNGDELGRRMAGEERDPDVLTFFLEEADDLLEDIDNAIQAWRDEPSDTSQGAVLNRVLHTLKGGARLAGLSLLGDLSHDLEALIIEQEGQLAKGDMAVFDLLYTRYDELVSVLDRVKLGDEELPAEELAAPIPEVAPELELTGLSLSEPEVTVTIEASEPVVQAPEGGDDLASRMAGEEHDPDVLPFFLEEADDLLEDIDNAIQAWRDEPSDTSQGAVLNRVLHTLKGGARLAGLSLLGDLSHDLEALIIEQEGQLANGDMAVFDLLYTRYDELVSVLDRVKPGGDAPSAEELLEPEAETETEIVLEPVAAPELPVTLEVVEDKPAEESVPDMASLDVKALVDEPQVAVDLPLAAMPAPELPAKAAARPKPATAVQESVKIPAQVLDNLVNLAGEASIARGRVEQGVGESASALDEMEETIARLRNQVRQLGRQTEAQIQFRREQIESSESADFDPLELDRYSQLQELSRGLEESGSDLQDLKDTLLEKSQAVEGLLLMQSRITQDLQENLMKTRLVPFSRLVPRLRRIVRQVGQELGKQVNLGLNNIEGEMDRSVLEKIITPIEHMLRNAMDHGIENAEQRLAAGKPEEGNISLSFQREGGEVVITVADDGKGLDVAAIREKAVSKKIIAADTQATDSELLRLIFQPGFSTATTVSQVSGRGVGMDVVKTEVHQLGGSISIESVLGLGVEFTIRLPFTVSVNKALLVKDGESVYALPLNSIVGVTQLGEGEIDTYYKQPDRRLEYAGLDYEVCPLGSLLHGGQEVLEAGFGKAVLVLIEADNYRYAVHVEAIEGHQEIIIKGLGAQFNNVPGVAGATILANGDVVIILDLPSLLRTVGERSILEGPALALGEEGSPDKALSMDAGVKTIMVVDDSVTVRKVTSRVLEREGFLVVTAKDGVEATEMLDQAKPDLMLLDIEMPRMDGFEVARVVRSSKDFSRLPIIMISSRTGEKHQQRARDLGVNEFLGKPYQEDRLLDLLDELLNFGFA